MRFLDTIKSKDFKLSCLQVLISLILFCIAMFIIGIFDVKAQTLTYSPDGLTFNYFDNNNYEFETYDKTDLETVSIYGDNFYKVKDAEVGNPIVPHQYYQIQGTAINSLSTDRYICYILYSKFEFSDTNLSPKGYLFNLYGQMFTSSSEAVTSVHANTTGSNYFYFYCTDLHDTSLTYYEMSNYGFNWLSNNPGNLPVWGASEFFLSDYYSFDTTADMQTFLTDKSNYYSSQTTGPNEIDTSDWFSPDVDTDDWGNTIQGWGHSFDSNASISTLITMPITLLTAILNHVNDSCTPFSIGSLYNTNLYFPCIYLRDYLTSDLIATIDLMIAGVLIFKIGKKFVVIFNNFTNLRDNQIDELYGGGK